MNPTEDDPVDEIRAIRQRISEQFGNDPEKLLAYYMEFQKRHAAQLIDTRATDETVAKAG